MIKATQRITKLRLSEVSLVGEGDNPDADVLILKHRQIVGVDLDVAKASLAEVRAAAIALATEISKGGSPMDMEQLTEKLDKIEKSLETVQAENATLKGQLDTVTKERDAALAEVEVEKAKKVPPKKQADGGADDPDADDEVMKGLPKAVLERIEKSEKDAKELRDQIEKERDERDELAQIEKVRATGLADADKFGKLLHRVAKGKSTPEDADGISELLTKAKALQDGGALLFTRIGKASANDGSANDAAGQLEEATTAIQKAKPALTREQAYAEACDANPKLYDELRGAKAA